MPDVVEAAPSAAIEVDRGALVTWTPEQRQEFRRTGEPPEQPKRQEEAAPSDAGKAPDGEPADPPAAKPQEHTEKGSRRKPGAEERIGELVSETKRLKAELEALKAKPAEAEKPRPVPPPTNSKPKPDDKKEDGKPKYESYEDYLEDLTTWKAKELLAESKRDDEKAQQTKAFLAKVDEAKTRYENFDQVLKPTLDAIEDKEIPQVIRTLIGESDILPDLIFALGNDAAERAKFITMAKTQPGKALRFVALTESLVHEELEAKAKPSVEKPPAKTQTSAPKPPAEVGGRGSTPPDALDSAARANDFRAFKTEADRRALARLKG